MATWAVEPGIVRWRRDDQFVALIAVFALILAVPLAWRAVRSSPPAPADARLDLNAATREELAALPGIGERRAEAILRFRAAHGRFRSVEELRSVPGLDGGTLDRIRPLVRVE